MRRNSGGAPLWSFCRKDLEEYPKLTLKFDVAMQKNHFINITAEPKLIGGPEPPEKTFKIGSLMGVKTILF